MNEKEKTNIEFLSFWAKYAQNEKELCLAFGCLKESKRDKKRRKLKKNGN